MCVYQIVCHDAARSGLWWGLWSGPGAFPLRTDLRTYITVGTKLFVAGSGSALVRLRGIFLNRFLKITTVIFVNVKIYYVRKQILLVFNF